MLPLYDDNPSRSRPWVTYALIVINVLVFLYQISLPDAALAHFVYEYAVVPKAFFRDLHAVEHGRVAAVQGLLPLFTNMFMHGGWLHLGGNMLFLYIFGDNVEDRMGHARYLGFYLTAGLIASLAHAWSAPGSTLPSLGASGAISGVLGAYAMLFPYAQVQTLITLGFFFTFRRIPAWVFLAVWFVLQSFQGLASLGVHSTATTGGTAWWAHIGGFVFGIVVGVLLRTSQPTRSPYADRWYSNR
jgi:membrane associated rhomboid family serine protease